MVFSTATFIFLFLPIIILIYYLSSPKIRNLVLFIGSLIFYAWGEPIYILIMLFSTFFDYFNGLLIDYFQKNNNNKKAKYILILSITVNLSILAFFKYSNFFIVNINNLLNLNINTLNISLPIGISFYTFQTLSYTIDVYLSNVKAQKNIINFACYVTLFPQLVAGPIVKYKDVEYELENRIESFSSFSYGVKRFIIGLFKKVLLANNIGLIYEEISLIPISNISILTSWLGAIAFSFQIYFDFSGYSDMAIGLGAMFGFKFLENFNYPYISKSISDFWRRWHISLSTWFKEYVYIPLGGNRTSKYKAIRNLLIVWILTGFWHGANWNFILWGLYFGLILILEKYYLKNLLNKLPDFILHIYSLILIIIGWVMFSFEDLYNLKKYLKAMFSFNNILYDNTFIYLFTSNIVLIIICFILSTPIIKNLIKKYENSSPIAYISESFGLFIMFFISINYLVSASYNPFLYFRF